MSGAIDPASSDKKTTPQVAYDGPPLPNIKIGKAYTVYAIALCDGDKLHSIIVDEDGWFYKTLESCAGKNGPWRLVNGKDLSDG